ncbi:hypothetical protein EIP86_009872 [Pleurotus ostreatoroseus]|nr:hypothetical protein EIP86_009872 [Pleurotus ostreatoroseus]
MNVLVALQTFRFKTHLQRLNSIVASSRAKLNFLEQLYRFHKQQGNPRVSIPTFNYKPLDLWLLRKEVHKLGGYDAVIRTKKWADLGRLLGYGAIPGTATQIKNSYAIVIVPYEHFCDRVKNSPSMSPNRFHDFTLKTHVNIQSTGKSSRQNGGDESMPSSPLTDSDSERSSVPDEPDHRNDSVRLRRSTRQASHDPSLRFHIFCLDPALSTIPKGQWFCHVCLFGTGGDFGFDEGDEHSLASFQARDLEFRKLWFTAHPPSDAGGIANTSTMATFPRGTTRPIRPSTSLAMWSCLRRM